MRVWTAHSGITRSKTYEMLAAKQIKAVKNGRQLLIDIPHGLLYLETLPEAQIRPRSKPRPRAIPLKYASLKRLIDS
jgi:hypothetical protein